MTVFELGRMRHLDLLALWCLLHPNRETGSDAAGYRLARLPKEVIAAAILAGAG